MRRLLDGGVAVHERSGDVGAPLYAAEILAATGFSDGRLAEYRTARWCARQALTSLGEPPVAIPRGDSGEPVWPRGIVGSITHCRGYRAAAVALRNEFVGVGIDAEPHEPLPGEVLPMVASSAERMHLRELCVRQPAVEWGRLLFCAKEAVYKAWFQAERAWLDFGDVEVSFHADHHFRSSFIRLAGDATWDHVDGRWGIRGNLAMAAVAVAAKPIPERPSPGPA